MDKCVRYTITLKTQHYINAEFLSKADLSKLKQIWNKS